MKKIISLAIGLVLSFFALADCSENGEPFAEKSYTRNLRISEINLNVRDREIEVSLSADEQIHL